MKYDTELLQEQIFEITTLDDLDLSSGNENIFSDFLYKLNEQLGTSDISTEFIPPPSGTLGGLVPRTKLVIKLPKFAFGLFQTIAAGLWMSYQRNDPLNMTVGGGFTFIDGINRIKKSFYKLKENEGEYCIYLATMQAVDYGFLYHKQTSELQKIWDQHQLIQKSCDETGCSYHNDQCTLKRERFEVIVHSLLERELLFKKNQELGISL